MFIAIQLRHECSVAAVAGERLRVEALLVLAHRLRRQEALSTEAALHILKKFTFVENYVEVLLLPLPRATSASGLPMPECCRTWRSTSCTC